MKKLPLSNPQLLLVAIALLSCGILITVNHYSSRVNASIRAYVAGESYYSKGQKDASRQLAFYLIHQDDHYYDLFKVYLKAPLGDSIARVNLLNEGPLDTIRAGFLQGKNHPDDLHHLIWLFQNFQNVPFMARAIEIWAEADGLVAELNQLADDIYADYQRTEASGLASENGFAYDQKLQWLNEIEDLTNKLTLKEREFTQHLTETSGKISTLLFYINIGIVLLIIGSATALWALLFRSVQTGKAELSIKNAELLATNYRLDHFIYATSHDLKSPINNLEGLLNLLKKEELSSENQVLTDKMQYTVDSLRQTILDIENLIKTDRLGSGDAEELDLEGLIEAVLKENEVALSESNAEVHRDIQCKTVYYPRTAMKSVLQNLISNAIKYRSPDRQCVIRIETERKGERIILRIADNGLGIDLAKNGEKLFGMFSRFHSHVPGSGLGLYAVKQVIERNGGRIELNSEPDKGTTLVVTV